jgi:hypothetical protein
VHGDHVRRQLEEDEVRDLVSRWKVWLPLLLTVLAGVGVTVIVSDDDGDNVPDHVSVTVNKAAGDGQPTKTITVPKAAVVQARQDAEDRALRDETPPAVPDAQLEQRDQAVQENIERTDPLPTAGASQGFAGCVTRFVVNQSSRGGVRPSVQVLHYTVSGNRAGWSDVNAIVALFNTRSFAASSNFVIDGEGNCAYIVPIEAKAWTQAGGNPFAISYEIVNTGSEGTYIAPAGLAKLASVMREVARRTGIPIRRGAINGCSPSRSGIVQHRDGGSCWGGHGDIAPYPVDPVIRAVAVGVAPATPLTRGEQRIVARVTNPKGSGHTRRYWCSRDARQRAAIRTAARARKGGWDQRKRGERYQALARPFKARC